ncbi:hypothetical protein KP509_20G042700 [Ceratopteris richardii]|nr:hypothetical protein KP509_20G042700 [Ceratopteris richardii]
MQVEKKVTFSNKIGTIESVHHHQNAVTTYTFPEPGLLEETIEVVKDKVWSFRNAWKGVADAFSKIGVSPTVFGYSSVPLHEEDYVKELGEDVLALAKVDADGDKPSSKEAITLSADDSPIEEDGLLEKEDEFEDIDHSFAESSRKDIDERRLLTRCVSE